MTNHPSFDSNAVQILSERTAYEAWLLEAVYSIAEQALFPVWDEDAVVYSLGAEKPKIYGFGGISITLSDWRPGFLNAGAPLIFAVTFKLMDMLVEWVLEANGARSTYRFEEKLKHLGMSPAFPPVVETRPWLKERLIGLYRTLEPFRGTIIHGSHFESTDGTLHVSSSKKGIVGPVEEIDANQLRRLALSVVSILRYVSGAWGIDHLREKILKHDLDELRPLHGLPSLDQKKPHHVCARVYLAGSNPGSFDASSVAQALTTVYHDHDCSFDLRLLMVTDSKVSAAYLIPWAELKEVGMKLAELAAIERFQISIPDSVPEEHLHAHLK